jgi:hypothetical protein
MMGIKNTESIEKSVKTEKPNIAEILPLTF